ncbi:recombinase family protein [Stutzerimonas chloritidismutans]|jgi:DNA invertase Pin-like site-specific DNA recombinase|uniref:recombinase family protein n=1 Tax=Stutzerimonas chloritidismutans TaxID=203192 RepID=UPI0028ADA98C|nr:recombinase family protein [Stutzerimonas chloritidismutans]
MKDTPTNAHLYLRASTKDQDAERALASLEQFASDHQLTVVATHAENVSGTTLERPALNTLLNSAKAGEVLLVESVDRLSRLSQADWTKLKTVIQEKGLKLVVADLPTSHMLVDDKGITGQIMQVINAMLIDLMATMARLDQEKRVERIKQGIAKKKAEQPEWKPTGKSKNQAKWDEVRKHLANEKLKKHEIAKLCEVGVATVYRIQKELSANA